jgi:uncharacterized protein
MDKIIGRERETQLLREALAANTSQFIALYGRRRVGKTFLIKSVYQDSLFFEMIGVNNAPLQRQINNFTTALKETTATRQILGKLPKQNNWFDAFQQLKKVIEQSNEPKKVLFFDELPWIDTHRSGFLSALEHFWNSWAAFRSDILIVICGSSASWMIRKVVNNKGGLYNRLTLRIRLIPFTLHETEKYLESKGVVLNHYQILTLYMVMGGIPHYLSHIKVGQSMTQIIEQFCFDKDGILHDEFKQLYHALFNQADKHISIITALAGVRKGMTRLDILKQTGLPNAGSTTRLLEELEESHFIERYIPIDRQMKEGVYRLTDFYSLFYLNFIQPQKLNKISEGVWTQLSQTATWQSYCGYTFENIWMMHLSQIKKALGISGVYTMVGTWSSRNIEGEGAQIDLLLDRNDNVINLCEIKFSNTEFEIDKDYAAVLRRKIRVFTTATKTRKSIFLTMLSTYGIVSNKHSIGFVTNSLDMDVLFEP